MLLRDVCNVHTCLQSNLKKAYVTIIPHTYIIFTSSLVTLNLFLPPKGLLFTRTIYIYNLQYIQYRQFDQREWFTVCMYSNHMFLLPPSMAVGAAFSWLYLVLCHQTTFLRLPSCTQRVHCTKPEPVFVDLLRRPGIDSLPGGPVRNPICRTGPPGYIGWRNRFLGIDAWAP